MSSERRLRSRGAGRMGEDAVQGAKTYISGKFCLNVSNRWYDDRVIGAESAKTEKSKEERQ